MKMTGTAAGFHGEEATRASHVSSVGSVKGGQAGPLDGSSLDCASAGARRCSNLCLTTQPVQRC